MSKRRQLSSRILLVLAAVMTTFGLLELSARVWLTRIADEETFVRYASIPQLERRFGEGLLDLAARRGKTPYSPHRYLGYYPTPNYERGPNRHNSLGYRGEEFPRVKPPGEFRIACLGGSTTYSAAVIDYREAYPFVLERAFEGAGFANVRVINAGGAGWSSLESLINLQFRVLSANPDMVLVYHGINDVHPRLVWPPERYLADNSGKRVPNVSSLVVAGPLEHSTLLRYLLIRSGRIQPHSSFRRTVDNAADSYYGDLFEQQWRAGTYPDGKFREVSAGEMFRANPPIHFRRNLQSIVAVARRHDVVPVLLTFAFLPGVKGMPHVSSQEYLTALAESNSVVRQVAAEEGVALIDVERRLPRDPKLFADGLHMTPAGQRARALLIARELTRMGLVPRPAGDSAAER